MSSYCALCHHVVAEAMDQHLCPALTYDCGKCGREIGDDEESAFVGDVLYHEGCKPEPEEALEPLKLAPCPFCGGAAFVEREMICVYAVRCNDCSARGPSVEEMRFEWSEPAANYCASKEWNKRANIPAEDQPGKDAKDVG